MAIEHQDHLINIIDESGKAIGQKCRKDIDKSIDLYCGVYTLVITAQKELVVSTIPERSDLPNIYTGKLGVTAATMRRQSETTYEAALRVLRHEVGISQPKPIRLGDACTVLSDGRKAYICAYYTIHDAPIAYNKKDITSISLMTAGELETKILTGHATVAPTLCFIWEKYRRQLPV
jgi:hypothetical protein